MRVLLSLLALAIGCSTASAAEGSSAPVTSSRQSLGALVAQGFEIKAAAPNGGRFVVWVQKDKMAYACIFTTVNDAPCEQIQ